MVETLLIENFASSEESKDAGALLSSKDMSSAFQKDTWDVIGAGGFSEHPLITGRSPSLVCCNPSKVAEGGVCTMALLRFTHPSSHYAALAGIFDADDIQRTSGSHPN